jgi:hypothetical protein
LIGRLYRSSRQDHLEQLIPVAADLGVEHAGQALDLVA